MTVFISMIMPMSMSISLSMPGVHFNAKFSMWLENLSFLKPVKTKSPKDDFAKH
jgi:hypothetical protein